MAARDNGFETVLTPIEEQCKELIDHLVSKLTKETRTEDSQSFGNNLIEILTMAVFLSIFSIGKLAYFKFRARRSSVI